MAFLSCFPLFVPFHLPPRWYNYTPHRHSLFSFCSSSFCFSAPTHSCYPYTSHLRLYSSTSSVLLLIYLFLLSYRQISYPDCILNILPYFASTDYHLSSLILPLTLISSHLLLLCLFIMLLVLRVLYLLRLLLFVLLLHLQQRCVTRPGRQSAAISVVSVVID